MFWLLLACAGPADTDTGTGNETIISGDFVDLRIEADADFPTVVHVSWSTADSGSSWVAFGDGLVTPQSEAATAHSRHLLGIPAGETASLQAFTELADGTVLASAVEAVSVDSAPSELPQVDIAVHDEQATHPWQYVLATFVQSHDGYVVILDRQGRYVWWAQTTNGLLPGTAKPSLDGTSLLWAQFDVEQRLDLGAVMRQPMDGSDFTLTRTVMAHHDFAETDDGNIAWIRMELEEEGDDTWAVDAVVEAPEGSNEYDPVTRHWGYSDLLEPSERCHHTTAEAYGSGGMDWTHANSLVFDEEAQVFYVMSKNLDTIHAIDRSTSTLLWQLGGEGSDFQMEGSEQDWFSHGHFSQIWEDGFTVFDNNYHEPNLEDDAGTSRAAAYAFDASTGIVEQVWSYEDPEERFVKLYGDVRQLDNGNYLTSWMSVGLIKEIDGDGNVVWQAANELGTATGRVRLLGDLYDLTENQ